QSKAIPKPPLLCAVMTAASLIASIDDAHSQCAWSSTPLPGCAPAKPGMMLRLSVPFGQMPSQSITLGVGAFSSNADHAHRTVFVPALRVGFSVDGRSVVNLGGTTVLSAEGESNARPTSLPTWAWAVLGAGAAVGLGVALSAGGDDNHKKRAPE